MEPETKKTPRLHYYLFTNKGSTYQASTRNVARWTPGTIIPGKPGDFDHLAPKSRPAEYKTESGALKAQKALKQ